MDTLLAKLGRRTFALTPANVRHPEAVEVRAIEPDNVRISLHERKTPPKAAAPGSGPAAE